MITKRKLIIYDRYEGDADFHAREGKMDMMENEDWGVIESLIQDLFLVQSGNASIGYIEKVNARLNQLCDNEETIEQLKKLALNVK